MPALTAGQSCVLRDLYEVLQGNVKGFRWNTHGACDDDDDANQTESRVVQTIFVITRLSLNTTVDGYFYVVNHDVYSIGRIQPLSPTVNDVLTV